MKDMGQFKFWGTQPVPRFGELLDVVYLERGK